MNEWERRGTAMEVGTPPGGEHFPLAGYSLGSSRRKLLKDSVSFLLFIT